MKVNDVLMYCAQDSTSVAGIKKYIVGLIIKLSGDPAQQMQEKVFLGKLNVILVQVWWCETCWSDKCGCV